MTRRSHLAVWLMGCLVCFALSPLWPGPGGVRQLDADAAAINAVFGHRVTGWLLQSLPIAGEGSESAERVGSRAAGHRHVLVAIQAGARAAERYAQALQVQAMRSVLRAMVMGVWAALLCPLAVAAMVDGLARRAIKADNLGYQNPAAFTLASHAVVASAMLPLLVIVVPFNVSPWFMPTWGLLAMVPLNVAIGHMQPVFTR